VETEKPQTLIRNKNATTTRIMRRILVITCALILSGS
jgi:hypothetical protein